MARFKVNFLSNSSCNTLRQRGLIKINIWKTSIKCCRYFGKRSMVYVLREVLLRLPKSEFMGFIEDTMSEYKG